MDGDAAATIRRNFEQAVNMTPAELEDWLETEESWKVGFKHRGDRESVGHRSGRRIVAIARKTVPELEDTDFEHMRKVVGYVRRHLAQRPAGDTSRTRWRYSLMNWGHDPMRD